MDTSIVKLSLLDANGKQRNTTWRTECYVKSLADAAEEGCRRLGIDNTFNLAMLDQTDAANEEEKLPDDVVEPKKMYYIVDRRIFDNFSTSNATASTSRLRQSSFHAAYQPSPSNIPSCLQTSSARTCSNSPSRIVGRLSSFSVNGSASTGTSTILAGPQASSSTLFGSYDTHLQPSRRREITQYLVKNEVSVNTAYESYAHLKPLLFFNTDLFDYFNDRVLPKCAVVVLHSNVGARLTDAAHYTLCHALKELIRESRPTFDIAHSELQPLPNLVNKLTSTQLFFNLTLDNHHGVIDQYVQRQRPALPSKHLSLKRKHPVNLEETLDEASSTIFQNADDTKLHSLYESTRHALLYSFF